MARRVASPKAAIVSRISSWLNAFGVTEGAKGEASVGTALALTTSPPGVSAGSALFPAWKICSTAVAPPLFATVASRVRPGRKRSSKAANSSVKPMPLACTWVQPVSTMPAPFTRRRYQAISSSETVPSEFPAQVVIGAMTTRLRSVMASVSGSGAKSVSRVIVVAILGCDGIVSLTRRSHRDLCSGPGLLR